MNEKRIKSFEEKIPEILAFSEIPGISIGIVHKNELIYGKGFGKAKAGTNKVLDEKSIYSIGSATKPFTACAIALLAEKGQLRLNDPIKNYYPKIEFMTDKLTNKVTFLDILTHRTGLPRHDWYWGFSTRTRQELIDGIKYLVPWEKYRSKFQYNNIMYMLAGYLVEVIDGRTWEDFVKDEFFAELYMSSSGFHSLHRGSGNRAFAHNKDKESGKLKTIKEFGFGAIGPAGSIVSNVEDLSRWLSLHISKGKVGNTRFYNSSTYKKIFKPHIEAEKSLSRYFKEYDQEYYGLGWRVHHYKGEKICWHSGGTEGFRSFVGFLPDSEYGIIVLANSVRHLVKQDGAYIIASYLLDILTGNKSTNWLAKFSKI